MEQVRRKVFMFGKVDYLGNGKKSCPVEVDLELRETDKGPELSICGIIWNHKMTDCYSCGQCIDDLAEYFKGNELYNKLARLWRLYHLKIVPEADLKEINELLK